VVLCAKRQQADGTSVGLSCSIAHTRPQTPTHAQVVGEHISEIGRLMAKGDISVDCIDVFCERGFFSVEQSRRVLEAGKVRCCVRQTAVVSLRETDCCCFVDRLLLFRRPPSPSPPQLQSLYSHDYLHTPTHAHISFAITNRIAILLPRIIFSLSLISLNSFTRIAHRQK
jgi:hypothetical protein